VSLVNPSLDGGTSFYRRESLADGVEGPTGRVELVDSGKKLSTWESLQDQRL
jgi:hypothetical protein